jgi:hypothetical protein
MNSLACYLILPIHPGALPGLHLRPLPVSLAALLPLNRGSWAICAVQQQGCLWGAGRVGWNFKIRVSTSGFEG